MNIKRRIGLRIREARKNVGITGNELAQATNLTPSRIANWEQGLRTPGPEHILSMAKVLKANPAWLMCLSEEQQHASALDTEYTLVPKYDVEASAGTGSEVSSEQVVDHLAFKTHWLKSLHLAENKLALITVKGDSMSPTLNDNDLVLIDRRQHELTQSAIYAIGMDNNIWVKRLSIRLDGGVTIISDNKEQYPCEELPKEQANKLRVIGRVIWAGHVLK